MTDWHDAGEHLASLLAHAALLIEGEVEDPPALPEFHLPERAPDGATTDLLLDLLSQVPDAIHALSARRDEVADEISQLATHRTAATAYVRSPTASD